MEKGAEFDESIDRVDLFDPLDIEDATTTETGVQKPDWKKLQQDFKRKDVL